MPNQTTVPDEILQAVLEASKQGRTEAEITAKFHGYAPEIGAILAMVVKLNQSG